MDPAWALPLNTALLIVLAYTQNRTHRKARRAERHAEDAKRAAGAMKRHHGAQDNGRRRRWSDTDQVEKLPLEEH